MALNREPFFECAVRFHTGTHVTTVCGGHRASSTAGAQQAADALGRKVYGDHFSHSELLTYLGSDASRHRIYRKGAGR